MSLLSFTIRGQHSANSGQLFEIERVESQSLDPSEDYVRRSLTKPSVSDYLKRERYKRNLYMVVGVKIGRNARIRQGSFNMMHNSISAVVPGCLSGIPVDPQIDLSIGKSQYTVLKRTLPESFVFAYRLREVRYSPKLHLNSLGKLLTKGARLHSSKSGEMMINSDETEVENPMEEAIEYDGLSGEDVSGESIHCENVIDGCILVDSPSDSRFPMYETVEDTEVEGDVILF